VEAIAGVLIIFKKQQKVTSFASSTLLHRFFTSYISWWQSTIAALLAQKGPD